MSVSVYYISLFHQEHGSNCKKKYRHASKQINNLRQSDLILN